MRSTEWFVELDVKDVFQGYELPSIQLIRPLNQRWGSTQSDVVQRIDLSVCRVSLNGATGTAIADKSFSVDESSRTIRFCHINDPARVLRHAFKYAAKGYTLSREQASVLLDDWSARPVEERSEDDSEEGHGY